LVGREGRAEQLAAASEVASFGSADPFHVPIAG